ncbi:MAG: hypothetical protein WCO51_03560 [bacterium]
MKIMSDFDEMVRQRNLRYLDDTMNMLVTLAERLLEGLRFEEYRKRLNDLKADNSSFEQREELLADMQNVFGRESARLQHRLEVLRYLNSELQERLSQPDMRAIALTPHELPSPEERPSLPLATQDDWVRAADLASQIEARTEPDGT